MVQYNWIKEKIFIDPQNMQFGKKNNLLRLRYFSFESIQVALGKKKGAGGSGI